jgi:hypothetical protein
VRRLVVFGLIVSLFACVSARAQQGNAISIPFVGVPTGGCANGIMFAVDLANGAFYDCYGGNWNAVTGGGGSSAFSSLTSGTNNAAAMLVGTGASLGTTGSGTIQASSVTGLSVAGGKTLTVSNSLTLAGTDGTTMTFPGSSDTVVTLAATQTLSNKTFVAPALGTPASVNLANATNLPAGALPAFTGDVTTSAGASVNTLATVNSNVGTFTYPSVTVNGKGLITAISNGTAPPSLPLSIANGGIGAATAAQNSVFAGPATGGAGAPSFQIAPTISAANMTNFPTLNQNTTGSAGSVAWSGVTAGSNTQTSAFSTAAPWTFSVAGAASTPGMSITGAPYTGGSATTNFPQFYINDGAGPTTFSAAGTELGINSPSGFTGNFLDLHVNGGASIASINYLGALSLGSSPPSCSEASSGTSGAWCGNEGTIPGSGPASGVDVNWDDSTNHCTHGNWNNVDVGCLQSTATIKTASNCSSSASPAVCGSAAAGSVYIPTGTVSETLTVNTSAVTANSQIIFYPDDSLGTKLSVTCNSTLATLVGGSAITARSAGTSFTITYNGTIATNGVCGSYLIVN